MTNAKRYVIYCNEEAYKDGGLKHLQYLERLSNAQVRAFRKAHKLLSWLEKRETQKPIFLLSTWREARPCIQAFARDPNLISMVKMVITCESAKQVHHVKRWVGLQPIQMPFPIEIALDTEALAIVRDSLAMDLNIHENLPTDPPLSSLALKMLQMPEPAKIKSDKGRLVSTLPALGVYSPAGFFKQVGVFDETSDILLDKKNHEGLSHASASTTNGTLTGCNGSYFTSTNSCNSCTWSSKCPFR